MEWNGLSTIKEEVCIIEYPEEMSTRNLATAASVREGELRAHAVGVMKCECL